MRTEDLISKPFKILQLFESADVSVSYLSIPLAICTKKLMYKRGSLLGNEEPHLGGDSLIFEIIYSNLEQRSIFS